MNASCHQYVEGCRDLPYTGFDLKTMIALGVVMLVIGLYCWFMWWLGKELGGE